MIFRGQEYGSAPLDRMPSIEAKRDNAEKKAKVAEGGAGGGEGGVVVRWRFSIDNQWSASAGLKVQRREIDLDSRYWLSQSDLVQGTPGTATVFAMQNREPPGLLADETGAHTPYVLFHRRTRPPSRATTHGYVRLFRYADDPSSESEKEKGRKEDGEGRFTFALFTRDESTWIACMCPGKGARRPSHLPHE